MLYEEVLLEIVVQNTRNRISTQNFYYQSYKIRILYLNIDLDQTVTTASSKD